MQVQQNEVLVLNCDEWLDDFYIRQLSISGMRSSRPPVNNPFASATDNEGDAEIATAVLALVNEVRRQRDQHNGARRNLYGLLLDALKWSVLEAAANEAPVNELYRHRMTLLEGGLKLTPFKYWSMESNET